MDPKLGLYVAYLVVTVALTVWVARTLFRNGQVFLKDALADEDLAASVNKLLVVGFYLLNLGYVSVAMKYGGAIDSVSQALEELSLKVGLVLLVLGALHFFNVFALNRYRRSRIRQQAPHPPLPPAGRLPMGPPPMPFGPGGPGAPAGPRPPAAPPPAPALP